MLSILLAFTLPLFSIPNKGLVRDSTYHFLWDHDQSEWIDSLKQIFKYDEQENLIEESSYLWVRETEMWVFINGLRKELTYDEYGNICQEIITVCNSAEGRWRYDRKKLFTYDGNGELIERSSYTWKDESREWVGDNSQFFQKWTYDQYGDLIHHEYYSWNAGMKDWVAFSKFEWRYDESRRITEKIQYKWNSECQAWTGIMRHTWDYNAIDGTTGIIHYDWYPGLSVWIPKSLRQSRYDHYGHLIRYTEFLWSYELMQWVCHGKSYACDYDRNGNLTEKTDYFWDMKIKAWLPVRRSSTTYDENGNAVENKYYNWDPVSGAWKINTGKERVVSTYDKAGNPVLIMHYLWDPTDSSWCRDGMEKLAYDTDGKQTEWSRYGWDTISGEWAGSCKECINIANDPCFRVIDMCGRTTSATELVADKGNWMEINTEIHYIWNADHKSWDYSKRTEQYWSKPDRVLLTEDKIKTRECKIYPNPFSDYTVITLPESVVTCKIELIDLYGRILRSTDYPSGRAFRLDRDGLPPGTYIIRILADDFYTKKVIIR
jgi:hypothetical protein